MGRPLPKRFFSADANDNIKVQFHNGSGSVPGYIVRQKGARKFLCKDASGNEAICTLVAKASGSLSAGEMSITVKKDDTTVVQAYKISRHLVSVENGNKLEWSFSTATDDGKVEIEEAGANVALGGATDLEGDD